jgi:hypothetical protein
MRRGAGIHARVLAVSVVAAAIQGCAAIPLAVVAGSVLEAGGGVLVKTGTEYSAGGTAMRTFNLPVEQVHAAVNEALRRAQVIVVKDEIAPKHQLIAGVAGGRKVRVRLIPLTPALTSMELDVKRNLLASDKATASELLAQTEHVLAEEPTVAVHNDEPPARDPSIRPAQHRH